MLNVQSAELLEDTRGTGALQPWQICVTRWRYKLAFHADFNKDISKHSPAPTALHRHGQELTQRLPVDPGDTKNMEDHSDHAGALRTNRSMLNDVGPSYSGRNRLNSASSHSLPHSQRKMNHTGSWCSTSHCSQSGVSPKLTMSWVSSFSMLTPQLPAAMLIAQHTKSLGQLLF